MDALTINIAENDDAASVLDRLSACRAGRVVLAWPDGGCGLQNRLDLVRVARRSRSLGIQVAVAARDPDARGLAREAGLPAFRGPAQAGRARWQVSRPGIDIHSRRRGLARLESLRPQAPQGNPLLSSRKVRLISAAAGLLAVLVLAGFMLPSARIHVQPQLSVQTAAWQVSALPSAGDLQRLAVQVLDAGIAPGFHAATATAQVTAAALPEGPDGSAGWKITAAREIVPDVPAERIAEMVRGQPLSRIAPLVGSVLPLAASPTMEIFPPGWPLAPWLPFQIRIDAG